MKKVDKTVSTPEDDYAQMTNDLENGQEKGSTTYIDSFDNCWKWKPGSFNIVSGYNNEGKGQWLRFLCLIKALEENKKFVFYSPEDYPSSDLYLDLIHTLAGYSTDKDNLNFISRDLYEHCFQLIKDKFYFLQIKPPQNTLSEIIRSFEELLENDKDIFGFIIDPHIKVTRDKEADTRDDLYGAYMTNMICNFSQQNSVVSFLAMHQQTPKKIEGTGLYPEPDGYYIKQGGSYIDTADTLQIVWRPNYAKDKLDPKVIIGTKKIKKQKLIGIPQLFTYSFNRKTNRYTDEEGIDLYNFNKWHPDFKKKINF